MTSVGAGDCRAGWDRGRDACDFEVQIHPTAIGEGSNFKWVQRRGALAVPPRRKESDLDVTGLSSSDLLATMRAVRQMGSEWRAVPKIRAVYWRTSIGKLAWTSHGRLPI